MRKTTLVAPNGNEIHLLVPETRSEREHGMNIGMTARPYAGMLFNFEPPTAAARMTMERTPIPLQIAFVGPDRIVHTVYAAAPASGVFTQREGELTRWVVETYGPWNLLKVGDRIGFKQS